MSSGIVAENIRLKRAYDSAGSGDGTRILIDRLWPRGSRKADAAIDVWPRILLLAQRCGGGSDTILHVGTSFDAATRRSTSASKPVTRTTYSRSERTDYTRLCSK
jgi:hypothetical protein